MRPDFVFVRFLRLRELVDQGETVAQGDDDFLDAGVFFYPVVKGEYAAGLCLALCLGIHDLASPQGIVSDDESALIQVFHHQLIVFDILSLVGVDEHEVITLAQRGDDIAGIADV